MSSTYAHYQIPASLPSDYAILSRYTPAVDDQENDDEPNDTYDAGISCRRGSFPTSYSGRPLRPTMGSAPSPSALVSEQNTEFTPLLGIHEMAPPNLNDLPTQGIPLVTPDEDEQATFWHLVMQELPVLAKFSLPVFGTHLLEYTLVVASVISIGHLSTTALAAITLGSMTASVTGLSIIQGFTSALDTMLPSAWTSDQPELVGLWSQRMGVVMAFCLVPIYAIWFNAESILLFLKQDPEVARLAALYLKWMSLGLPAYALNAISRRYFQSQGLFTVPTRIILVVAPLNIVLNYFLVWGPSWCRLGFIGAPLSTAISFNVIAVLSVIYGIFYTSPVAWYPVGRRSFTNLGVLVQLGLAGVAQTSSEWWAWELVSLAASLLGPVVLACQSVLLVSASSTFQAPFALSVATSVRIGNLLGEGHARRAEVSAMAAVLLSLVVSAISSALFMIFKNKWAYIFNSDPEVVSLVSSMMPLLALFQVFDGITAITGGVFRARGKQFTGALLNLSAYYVFGIPLGIWLCFSFNLGLHGLWLGLTFALIYCSIAGLALTWNTDWHHEQRKAAARVEAERLAQLQERHSKRHSTILEADEEAPLLS
ncbi:MATE efflux family protein [Pterulicium gracile]|uniref:MATE efflux family protein n=1 Tax=Pterulicium gracile TaxID=1884261 RepID=A0A5C3QIR1_9AGAR|nr:MATE efflux family protein [Pterula gracilis]